MSHPLRALVRWTTATVALLAGLLALFALTAWWHTAGLAYNTEGRFFDAEETVVHTDAEPPFWAVMGCGAVVLGTGAGLLGWRVRIGRARS